MIVLDCESRDSALDSVSGIYSVPRNDIEEFLHALDLHKHYVETDPPRTADHELALLFETQLKCSATPLDRVFWFHLTRAQFNTDFNDGIQPLDTALTRIWETIFEVFVNTRHEKNLRILKSDGVPNFLYNMKVGQPLNGGPYAMLVREAAFRAKEMRNHDYLWLPEIMEDICNGYHKAYGELIHDDLCRALTPYIVKFWSQKQISKSCVDSAMYYLYRTAHGQSLNIDANTCFDGRNSSVPREQITYVEPLSKFYNSPE